MSFSHKTAVQLCAKLAVMKKKIVQIAAVIMIIAVLAVIYIVKQNNVSEALSEPVVNVNINTDPAGSTEAVTEDVPVSAESSGTAGIAAADESTPESVQETAVQAEPLFVTEIDEEALRSSGIPVMIQFFSTTCIPCMSMMDDLRTFYAENYGRVKVIALNVSEYPEAAMMYPVSVVPTQLFFTSQGENYIPSDRIRASVGNFAAYTYKDTGEIAYVVHQGILTQSQMKRITDDAGAM